MGGTISYGAELLAVHFFLVFNGVNLTYGNEAVLLDTRTATSDLGWTKSPDSEWQEASSPHPDADERRMLMVCQVQSPKQDNWVRTPFIRSDGAQRVYVEFEFTIRSCEGIAEVATCKETFNLFYYETDRDEATTTFPPWNEEAYKKVDTVAADKRFRPGSEVTNFEVRDIGPLTKNGLYVAIQDTGACIAIMHVRVFYKYCPPIEANLAQFPRTNAGAERTALVEVEGLCIVNSLQEGETSALFCNSDGEWVVPKGQCSCDVGYSPNREVTRCEACDQGLYKPDPGNEPCLKCPFYSHSAQRGSSICECMVGYFRSLSETASSPCSKPPSKPTQLQISRTQRGAMLTWEAPKNDGGRNDLKYRIECQTCSFGSSQCVLCPSSVRFTPPHKEFHVTKVKVQGFTSNGSYKFIVYAENGVSEVSQNEVGEINYASITLAPLRKLLPIISGLTAKEVGFATINLTWNKPQSFNNGLLQYEVIVSDFNNRKTIATIRSSNVRANVSGLIPNKEYFIKVRAHSAKHYGGFSDPIKVRTQKLEVSSPTEETPGPYFYPVQTLFGVLAGVIVIIIIIIGVFIHRRNQLFARKTQVNFEKHPMFNAGSLLVPGVVLNRKKTYVDPTTYGNTQRALLEFAKELSASCVSIESTLGGGEFGDVCRGYIRSTMNGKKTQEVAIKTLKSEYSEVQKQDFLTEASIMGQFDHPNVIRLEGVVTRSTPFMIITEYMENGALDAFLRKHDGEFSVMELVRMLRNIAAGMKYLSDMGYVHRDLAARNVLIDSEMICKVSDFGLSRELEDDNATYTTTGGKIPIRWTAPEAITFRKFTSASDVWSFGIVMWEVLSYGERPYWGMSNRDVISAVETGYRLPAPMDCPILQHQLMLECWRKDRNERPKFSCILLQMDEMLRNPEKMKVTANMAIAKQQQNFENITPASNKFSLGSANLQVSTRSLPNDFRRFSFDSSSIGNWLNSFGLGKYKENFIMHGYLTMEQIILMQSSDFERIGITNVQHQALIHRSILSTQSSTLNRVQILKRLDDNLKGVPV